MPNKAGLYTLLIALCAPGLGCSSGFKAETAVVSGMDQSSSAPGVILPPPPPPPPIDDFFKNDFFGHFVFEAIPDPTHGYVTYVDAGTANTRHLTYVDNQTGHAIITVDSQSIGSGSGRQAVRLKSQSVYNSGLFIIDVAHMPEGLGTWPAFWSVGPSWPNSGEIDVIEGVNNSSINASTLHTKAGCSMSVVDETKLMTGHYNGSRDCNSSNANNGCSTQGAAGSFGPVFNQNGGGVYAYIWEETRIAVYFWPRNTVPVDVKAGSPHPLTWGLPVSYFQLGTSCPANYFAQHNLIINTTFCGDWAGAVYKGSNGSGNAACADYVKNNPNDFKNAYWEIASLRAYSVQ